MRFRRPVGGRALTVGQQRPAAPIRWTPKSKPAPTERSGARRLFSKTRLGCGRDFRWRRPNLAKAQWSSRADRHQSLYDNKTCLLINGQSRLPRDGNWQPSPGWSTGRPNNEVLNRARTGEPSSCFLADLLAASSIMFQTSRWPDLIESAHLSSDSTYLKLVCALVAPDGCLLLVRLKVVYYCTC